ncbi:MAG: ABC transporter substrate-binding protein [Deltaproteobacteria bacterium]|nr:ABC transporter substrate-binding protein [Deltaproteobacteria bacterium]
MSMRMAGRKRTLVPAIAAVFLLASSGLGAGPLFLERKSVKIALGPDDLFHGYVQLAAAMGLLGQHGLDAQLLVADSGEKAARAVIRGRGLFGVHDFQQVLLAREREEPLLAIAKGMEGPGLRIMTRDPALVQAWLSRRLRGAKKFALLRGMRIGVDGSDMLRAQWVRWMAGRAGLDARKDFEIIDVGPGIDGMAALKSGAVQYLAARSPAAEMIQDRRAGRIVWPERYEPGEPAPLYLVVSMYEDSVKAYPEMPGKFLRALRASFVLMRKQQEHTFSIAQRLWPRIPEAALRRAMINTLPLLPEDLLLTEDGAELTMKLMLEAGMLKRKVSLEEACTNWFVR